MSVISTELPTRPEFLEHLNSNFRLTPTSGDPFDIELLKLDIGVSNAVQESFALLFRAPVDAPQVQSLYRLEHKDLGEMDLFLVPVNKDDKGLYYEAIFNHLLI